MRATRMGAIVFLTENFISVFGSHWHLSLIITLSSFSSFERITSRPTFGLTEQFTANKRKLPRIRRFRLSISNSLTNSKL